MIEPHRGDNGHSPQPSGSTGWRSSGPLTVLVWAVAFAFAAWTIVRTTGVERGFPAVALMAFTPYVTLLAPLAAGIALLLARRRAALAIALCAGALIAQVAPRAIPDAPPDPRPQGPELRVLGANLLEGQASLAPIAELIREREIEAVGFVELPPAAAALISRSKISKLLPHAILNPREGSFGAGLLSRYPLRRRPAAIPTGDAQTLVATVVLPDGTSAELQLIHPYPPTDSYATKQLGDYLGAVPATGPQGAPRLLIGDFNATLDSADLRDVLDRGYVDAADARGEGLATTWPQRRTFPPPVTIDHVLVDERVEVLDYGSAELPGSDHRAVFAALRLPVPSSPAAAGG